MTFVMYIFTFSDENTKKHSPYGDLLLILDGFLLFIFVLLPPT